MKLRIKVPLLIGIIVLVTSASIIISAEQIITREMETSLYNEITGSSEVNAEMFKTKMDNLQVQLWEIANRARTRTMNWDYVRDTLQPDVPRIDCLDIGLVFPDGTTRYVTDNSTANLGDRDYVRHAFAGRANASDVIISRVINKPVVMFASPVLQNDNKGAPAIGVLVARKDASVYLTGLLNQAKITIKGGYGFLINGSGTYVAHPKPELVLSEYNPIKEAQTDSSLKSLSEMIAKAVKEGSGIASYNQDGKTMLCAYSKIQDYPWIFILTVEKDNALAHITSIRFTMLMIGIICAVIGIIIAFIIGRSIAKPILHIAATLKDIGEGDLTPRINISSKDEIGDLSQNINSTLENIKNLVLVIKREADTLTGIGSTLTENSKRSEQSAAEIGSTIEKVRERVSYQSASVKETNTTIDHIRDNITKLNDHVENQSGSVSKSSSAVEEMLANIQSVTQTLVKNSQNVKELIESSEVGRTSLADVAADIQEIARESEGLLEINSVIDNIASQTNLLSMNAAIQAAHAGDAGRGFAVVAGEIRKLAESSGNQSKTISAVLKKITESINKITRSTDNVLQKFTLIDNGVKTVSGQEERIRDAMEEQGAGSKQILEAISQLNEITQQVKGETQIMLNDGKEIISEGTILEKASQEITDGMNDMAKGADQIGMAVKELNEISGKNKLIINNLTDAVRHFKVE